MGDRADGSGAAGAESVVIAPGANHRGRRLPRRNATGLMALSWITGALLVALVVTLSALSELRWLPMMLPALAAISIALVFLQRLRRMAPDGLIGEIGALYVLFLLAYTVFPAFTFVVLELDVASGWVWYNLTRLLPDDADLAAHLWRHVLFMGGVCLGYLLVRRKPRTGAAIAARAPWDGGGLLLPMVFVVILSNILLVVLSGPVEEYHDHYTRYDHLPSVVRALVSAVVRLESGLFLAVVAIAFMNFRKHPMIAIGLVFGAFVFKIWNSLGSRIESLFVLLLAVCLYQTYVNRISVGKSAMGLLLAGTLYSMLEVLRAANFNLQAAGALIAAAGIQPASEFGAVFFTSFHLYAERAAGTLPPVEWPMFFNDLISLVMPNSFVQFNPQYWYAENYYPSYEVPPQTNGPIADSAIWGGEWDLLVRSLINGMLFAWLANVFFAHKNDWRVAMIYAFCYSTCVMTAKYSVLYHLNPLVKTVIPIILLVSMAKGLAGNFLGSARHPRISRPAPSSAR
jgi:hypothetical protein